MTANLEAAVRRLRETFGRQVGQPVAHGGLVALPTALAATPANLAALEAAWRFDGGVEQGEDVRR